MPPKRCPEGKVSSRVDICRQPKGRKECPPGTFPTLSCRRAGSAARRQARPRRELSRQEAERIIDVLRDLKPRITRQAPNAEESAALHMPEGRVHEDGARYLFDMDTALLSESYFRIPVFFLYAFPRMSESKYRDSHPDPIERYEELKKQFMENVRVTRVPLTYKYVLLKTYLLTFAPKALRDTEI